MCKQQIRRLQEAISNSTATDGVNLADFSQLMKSHTNDVYSAREEGTFQRLFWLSSRWLILSRTANQCTGTHLSLNGVCT